MVSKKHRKTSGNSKGKDKDIKSQGSSVTPPMPMPLPRMQNMPMTAPMSAHSNTLLGQAREVLYGTDLSQHQNMHQNIQGMQNVPNLQRSFSPVHVHPSQQAVQSTSTQQSQQFQQPQPQQFLPNSAPNIQTSAALLMNMNDQCQQTMYTGNIGIDQQSSHIQSEAPPWCATMLKSLDSRLQNIETQLMQQN